MRNKVILTLLLILLTVLYACSNKQETKLGTHISDLDSFISLRLLSGNKFVLNGPVQISHVVAGDYSIENEALILTAHNDKEYVFSIDNNSLIFS